MDVCQRKQKLKNLQGLRGVAILAIVVSHCNFKQTFAWADFCPLGSLGVEIFILLSGFLSCYWHFEERQASITFWGSWERIKKKMGKYYPLHIITMLLAMPLAYDALTDGHAFAWVKLLLNAALLQSWCFREEIAWSYNGVAWFLSLMGFFVIITPRMISWFQRQDVRSVRNMILGILVFEWIWAIVAMPFKHHTWLVYIFPFVRSADLFLGGGTYILYRWILLHDAWVSRQSEKMVGIALLAYIVTAWLAQGSQQEVYSVAAWTVPSILFLLGIMLMGNKVYGGVAFWNYPCMIWIGNISFELFLIHQLTIRYFEKMAMVVWQVQLPVAGYAVAIMVSIFLSAMVHRYRVERRTGGK